MTLRNLGYAAVLAAVLPVCQSLAADLHVPSTHPTIGEALAAASQGDRIVIAPGSYHEFDLVLKAGVDLIGEPSAPGSVVIDAMAQGRVLLAANLDLPVQISGVTLTGGLAEGDNAHQNSGGGLLVDNAEVRLQDTHLIGNTASGSGGGLRATGGIVELIRCRLQENVAGAGGGGLELCYEASGTISETEFEENTAGWGGAVAVRFLSSATFHDSRFTDNRATSSPGLGGAVASDLDAALDLVRCVLTANQASYGGALYTASSATPTLTAVTIDQNSGSVSGGGLYCKNSSPGLTQAVISFNSPSAFNCLDGAHPILVQSNIYGHDEGDWTGDLAAQLHVAENFSADPLYCGPGDHHLQAESPCLPQNNGFGLVGALGQGCDSPTDVPPAATPLALGAQPNPFNPLTEVVYSVPQSGPVRVSVFDPRGRRLAVLVRSDQAAGEHRVRWEGRDESGRSLASGLYILVLETGGQRLTSKIMLAR